MKAIGFQLAHIAQSSRLRGEIIQQATLRAVEAEIVRQWAVGIARRDVAKGGRRPRGAGGMDRKNPETPIAIKGLASSAARRDMQSRPAERLVKSVPKELRGQAREALSVE
ncbi:hypothetical protein [Cupriavidus plantarum]|uniref:hypothetical protein n=1 Tax=Cupriavidus plantarum TaxID=942865 RepID=UPI000EAE9FB9|nr:hypothetical protein [Cupriavidus plantarum]RLK44970.1 hypothetical protein C7417_0973 [Cupriavidus plantarum]